MEQRGFTVWFLGLPFSGKKQLASMLSAKLESLGFHNEILEGGKIRREFDQELGFTKKEINKNIQRICFECRMLTENNIVAIAITISPYQEMREKCRKEIKDFVEVYCTAPIEFLRKRDTKNFYERAEQGEIQNVAGISAPFDEPIEKMWVEQWLFFANSTRFASAMVGADYGVFANGRWYLSKNLQEMVEWLKAKLENAQELETQ